MLEGLNEKQKCCVSSKALDKKIIYMNIYISFRIVIVRNKSIKLQCLVFVIVVKSRVKREITVLDCPLLTAILDNPCASVSCKSVIWA